MDPDRIRQAIDDLLANAVRFAPAGTVIVSLRPGKTAPDPGRPGDWSSGGRPEAAP